MNFKSASALRVGFLPAVLVMGIASMAASNPAAAPAVAPVQPESIQPATAVMPRVTIPTPEADSRSLSATRTRELELATTREILRQAIGPQGEFRPAWPTRFAIDHAAALQKLHQAWDNCCQGPAACPTRRQELLNQSRVMRQSLRADVRARRVGVLEYLDIARRLRAIELAAIHTPHKLLHEPVLLADEDASVPTVYKE